MFFKTFAEKQREVKGARYDRDTRAMKAEIAQLQGMVAEDTGRWQDLWRGERAANDRLRAALEFYRDPFAWKKLHDPDDNVRVPDFYSETSFGDKAEAALSDQQGTPQT